MNLPSSFSFTSVQHIFASIIQGIVKFGAKAATFEPTVEAATGAVGIVYPQALVAVPIERASFAALAAVVTVLKDIPLGSIPPGGVSIQLTQQLATDIHALVPTILDVAKTSGWDTSGNVAKVAAVTEAVTAVVAAPKVP